jgi:hypothetical protein
MVHNLPRRARLFHKAQTSEDSYLKSNEVREFTALLDGLYRTHAGKPFDEVVRALRKDLPIQHRRGGGWLKHFAWEISERRRPWLE